MPTDNDKTIAIRRARVKETEANYLVPKNQIDFVACGVPEAVIKQLDDNFILTIPIISCGRGGPRF